MGSDFNVENTHVHILFCFYQNIIRSYIQSLYKLQNYDKEQDLKYKVKNHGNWPSSDVMKTDDETDGVSFSIDVHNLTYSELSRSWSSSPLTCNRNPFSHHELASRRVEHSLPYSDVNIFIVDIQYLLPTLCVYWFLGPIRLVWLLVSYLYDEFYFEIFKCTSFW